MLDLRDRIAGSLYGLLVGDALGCPVEGWTPEEIRTAYGLLQTMEEARKRWRPAGLHSDDGQQALALCDALLQDPRAPSRAFARLLVELYQAGPQRRNCFGLHRGTGRNLRQAVQALIQGCPPHAAGQPSAGNGVAMLIAPLALYWRDDDEALAVAVVDVGRVKHTDPRSLAAAGAVAWVTARALGHQNFTEIQPLALLDFVRHVEDLAVAATGNRQHPRTFSEALEQMLAHRHEARPDVLHRIAEVASRTGHQDLNPCSGYALASVISSLYLALSSTSFRSALIDTVNLGGDADTTGAMVGAMTGALYGKEAIPAEWYEKLHARDQFDDRVEALVERYQGWSPVVPLITLEAGWTALYDRK